MKWLIRGVLGVVVLLALMAGAAFLLPATVEVSRSTTIDATPAQVFPYVNDLRNFNKWSPWAKQDPEAHYTFGGTERGIGQKMSWASDDPNVGAGTQEITASTPNQSVEVALDFGDMGQATASYRLSAKQGKTEVTWRFSSDNGANPLKRYIGLMMDRWLGPVYEEGLAALKKLVEDELKSQG